MRKMKDSGIEWIGQIPERWDIWPTKRFFKHTKTLAVEQVDSYERLALTMNGVIKRSKDDSEGLQPEKFDTYQVLCENELVFKLIDLANVKTSRVGLSPYTGIVSPAYIILRNNNRDNRFYYYYFMSMYYNEIFNNLGDNGVRSSLNAQDLLNIPMVSISHSLQIRIADFLDDKCGKIDRYIEKQQQIIDKLKAYKQAVITEAVTKGLDPGVPMKDSGNDTIGRIPQHWSVIKFKYISDAIGDGLHSTPEYDADGDYYFLNGNNIGAETLVFKENTDRLNEVEFHKYKPVNINDRTILITLNGATYGKTSFYNSEKVLLGKSAGYITLKNGENKHFVRLYLQSYVARLIMELSLCGSTIANLSLRTLNEFVMPYPPTNERDEIVDYLSAKCTEIDIVISKKQAVIDKLTEYKKSLIYEAVTGKLEV